MIYLASPYSALASDMLSDEAAKNLRHYRYIRTMAAQKAMFQMGYPVFATIVHTHITARIYGLPTDAEFWKVYNHHMIDLSKALFILELPRWEDSLGVRDEIDYAYSKAIPTYSIEVHHRKDDILFQIPYVPELMTMKKVRQVQTESCSVPTVATSTVLVE